MNNRPILTTLVCVVLVAGLSFLFIQDLGHSPKEFGSTSNRSGEVQDNSVDTESVSRPTKSVAKASNPTVEKSEKPVFLDSAGNKHSSKEMAHVADQFRTQLAEFRQTQKNPLKRVEVDYRKTKAYKLALDRLPRQHPNWPRSRILETAKKLAAEQTEFRIERPKIGESSAMLKQDIVIKVRNGRGQRDGRANVNIEIRAQKRGLPNMMSLTIHHDPNLRFLEARPGQNMRRFDKIVQAKAPSPGIINITMSGGSVIIQPGVFLTIDFEVTNLANDSSKIYASHIVPESTSYEKYKVGAVGGIMTIDPKPNTNK